MGSVSRVYGLGFRVYGLGIEGLGFRMYSSTSSEQFTRGCRVTQGGLQGPPRARRRRRVRERERQRDRSNMVDATFQPFQFKVYVNGILVTLTPNIWSQL